MMGWGESNTLSSSNIPVFLLFPFSFAPAPPAADLTYE